MQRLLGLAVGVAIVVVPLNAHAGPTKDQCVDANTSAQRLRLAGKLSAARAQLRICADPACPPIVRDDCTLRIDEVGAAQPTIVLDVKDPDGGDVTGVRVLVDGAVLSDRLDGTALKVDPGEHTFRFEIGGQPPITRSFVIKEAEKQRRERIVLSRDSTPATPPTEPAPSVPSSPLGRQRVIAVAMGSAGLAGLVVGGIFGALADVAWGRQESACGSPTACTNHAAAVNDHASLTTDGAVSTAAFIAGGALVAGGLALFFTAPHRTASASAIVLAPVVGAHGVTLGLGGSF